MCGYGHSHPTDELKSELRCLRLVKLNQVKIGLTTNLPHVVKSLKVSTLVLHYIPNQYYLIATQPLLATVDSADKELGSTFAELGILVRSRPT
jgi:hypothetical protein